MINYDGLYNKDFFGDKLKPQNHLSPGKLQVEIIEDGAIFPLIYRSKLDSGLGGIVDAEGNFIVESYLNLDDASIHNVYYEIPYMDETVIYFGMLVNIWGHCLTDNIKRLWFFLSDTYKKYFQNCRIVYLPMWYGIISQFARLLEIIGFDVNKLQEVKQPTRFREIVLPNASFFTKKEGGIRLYTSEYVETIERARYFAQKNFSPLSAKKFYFFHGRNQIGEEYLAAYFHAKGYETIQPETLSIEEQLNILANCENFASNIGSISHNTLFLKDGTETLLIPRTSSDALNLYQPAINQMRNLKVYYVDSALSIFKKDYNGPYCYIVSENLRKHFGDEITENFSIEDFFVFATYLEKVKSDGLKINADEETYLKDIFPKFLRQFMKHTKIFKK